jgi:hypothetical protein
MGLSRIWDLTPPRSLCQPPCHPFAFPAASRPSQEDAKSTRLRPGCQALLAGPGTSLRPGGETTALPKEGRPKSIPGDDLLSHTLARAVPSALRGLTAVFGMGTGVSPSPESPENLNFKRTEIFSDQS